MRKSSVFIGAIILAVSVQAATYYVSAARPNDSGNGTSWGTAKKTIQAAVDLTVNGDYVFVTNGTYNTGGTIIRAFDYPFSLTNRVVVTNSITVKSLNGPDVTVIEGSGASQFGTPSAARCVYMSKGILDGFTLQNGATFGSTYLGSVNDKEYETSGGGVNMYLSAPGTYATNCIIRNCAAGSGGGAAYGDLRNCVIADNSAYGNFGTSTRGYGGGVYRCLTLRECRIERNTISISGNNGSGYSTYGTGGGGYLGTYINCSIISNLVGVGTAPQYAVAYGGGVGFGTLTNCLVVGNTVTTYGSPNGGGVYQGSICNSTITKNSCVQTLTPPSFSFSGSRIFSGGGNYQSTIRNSIVYDNSIQSSNQTTNNYFEGDIAFSCTSPMPASGTGNIDHDPGFVDAPTWDFRLQTNSSCINSGNNLYVNTAKDLAGLPRIHNGTVDMGAYESIPVFTVSFNAQGGTAPAPSSIMVTNSFAYGTLATTIKAGYIFGGWYTNAVYTGSAITTATIVTLTSTHTLYAKWTLDPYYVAGGANATPIGITSAVNPDTVHSGDGLNSIKLGGMGLLADGQMAGIEWSATGPGILIFDWKVSSEADYDWLRFYEAGSGPTNQISGNVDWSRRSVTVLGATDLPHTFRWEYQKDPAGDYVGLDSGWVDAISWTPLYTVTVNNGSGDGFYTNNAYTSFTADTPATHYEFDRWIGNTNTVANIFAASTTLRMSNTNVIVTATYKPILYTLSASNASGGGTYPYATTVEIRASAFENKRFYCWTGDVASVANVNAATTTVVTSDHTISLTATYNVPLTVNSGTGSGWYLEGSRVNVSANADPMWKEFAVWTGDSGLLSNANARATTLTLPTGPVSVTATYRDSIARLTGSFGGTYSASGTTGAITPDEDAGSPSGTPAVKLGGAGVIPDNGFAAFETVVSGSGSILFSWKVSSELNGDYLKFKIDGGEVAAISGTKGPWTQVSNRVETAGSHTLRWEYVKNGSNASSTDAGWVDDIVWLGDVPDPVIRPDIQTVNLGANLLTLSFLGERGIPYTICSNATLSSMGWEPMTLEPEEKGETNGLFRFEAIITPDPSQPACFYRILGGQENRYLIIDLSGGTNAVSYPLSYLDTVPAGGWTDEYKTTKLVMRKISKGTFTMGGRATDYPDAVDDGLHTVTLTKDFYIGVFEVTQRQWELVMGNKPSYFDNTTYYATRPVDQVSYYDIRENPSNADDPSVEWPSNTNVHATSFMGKLRAKTGVSTLDLPTESQWEYACRANTTTALNSGYDLTSTDSDTHMDAVGRYYSNGGLVDHVTWPPSNCTIANATTKVGSYLPNILGLYDMHGNAWEWCLDWSGTYSESTIDPVGPVSGTARLFRGGGWYEGAAGCRSARRVMHDPSRRAFENGFRLTMTLP